MDYKVKPERIDGKVIKTRVFCQDGSELGFIRSDEGEIIRDQSMGKCRINDSDYAKIYWQVCGIFNPSKSRAKKIKARTTTKVKKRRLSKTQELHLQITNYKTKHSCTWTEAAFEIIKALPNYPLQSSGWLAELTKEERQWLYNLRNAGMMVLTEGWLETRRWERMASGKLKRIVSKVEGINSALRMQDHILEQYRIDQPNQESELTRLETIEEVVLQVGHLFNRWSVAGREQQEQIQKNIAWTVLQLENCRNIFKVEAREQLGKAMQMKDSLNRINPGVMAAHTVTALNRLVKRFNELEMIMPVIALRKELLIFEKRRLQTAVNRAAAAIHGITRHVVFVGGSVSGQLFWIKKSLFKILSNLATVWLSPYWEQAEQAKYYLEQALGFLNLSVFDRAKTNLLTAYDILKTDRSHAG